MMPLDDPHGPVTGSPRLLSEINVTPFIDVMLVLLVIFMVAAPLMMVGVPLKLPQSSAVPLASPREPLIVSIDRDGRTFLGDAPVDADGLPAAVAERLRGQPDTVVYVRGDKAVDYGQVMALLGRLGQGGVARLSLVAEGQALPPSAVTKP